MYVATIISLGLCVLNNVNVPVTILHKCAIDLLLMVSIALVF